MKIRIRGPEGQATIELSETATVEDLHSRITEKTNIVNFTISYGYPHLKPLVLRDYAGPVKLSEIGINLDGEQLIVRETGPPSLQGKPRPSSPSPEVATTDGTLGSSTTLAQSSFSFAKVGTAPPAAQKPNTPLSLTDRSKSVSLDVPEVPLPTHASTLLLRIMPDDNSCLFRAFNTAFFGAIDNMHELRSIIAQNIQSNPDVYSAVVLEQNPDDYCVWIQSDDAWGGAIELGILSKHFDIEICSIDVQTLRTDRYNEGRPQRCILVYSGIHYDTIALSPSDEPYDHAYAPPELDTKIFNATDEIVLGAAVKLCRLLQRKHYYTDTTAFSVRCNVCGKVSIGEKGATEHAKRTGHYDFGEDE